MTMDQQLPFNLEAERAVIGSLFLDRDSIIAVAPSLTADDFYLPAHREIFAAALDCYSRRVPGDIITVGEVLRQAGTLAEHGGEPGLAQYSLAVPTAYHVEYYAQIVADTALSRAMIQAGGNIASVGYEPLDRAALVHKAQQLLERATQRQQGSAWVYGDQVSIDWRAAKETGKSAPVSTGIPSLDQHLGGGMYRGELLLLAARTSVGKTSLALQLTRNLMKCETLVPRFSIEMDRNALWDRMVSSVARVPVEKVRNYALPGVCSDQELIAIAEADGRLSEYGRSFSVIDARGVTITDIRNAALALQAERGQIGLLVVDYIQLAASPGRRDQNRVLEIGEVSRGLRRLAGELNCPVLALAQLKRGAGEGENKIPLLSDLRESGNLEQDADVVMFLDREELYNKNTQKKGVVDVHIAKQRQGPLGVVPLFFKAEFGRWSEMTYQSPEGY
jgi:replicative DNA helicase